MEVDAFPVDHIIMVNPDFLLITKVMVSRKITIRKKGKIIKVISKTLVPDAF